MEFILFSPVVIAVLWAAAKAVAHHMCTRVRVGRNMTIAMTREEARQQVNADVLRAITQLTTHKEGVR